MDYKTSGVDIEAGYKSVELMKKTHCQDNETGGTWRNRWILRCIFHGEIQRYGRAYSGFRNRRMWNQG